MLKLTVLVPTYARVHDLARCLTALQRQSRSPDEVLLVVRDTDNETWAFLQNSHLEIPVRPVTVTITGQVAALNVGLAAATGDIIAITDDDAEPHPDWLAKIEAHFASDDRIGGVGGRDIVYINGQEYYHHQATEVGRLAWMGKPIGNHHVGVGKAREVDILKGANMSYRRQAIGTIRFDSRLRGTGAQVHNDLAFSLAIKRQGWKLLYDPAVCVNHYCAERFDEDARNTFNAKAFANQIHNETLALLDYLSPLRRLVFILWFNLVGSRNNLGLVQLCRLLPQEGHRAIAKWQASMQGRMAGWHTWRQTS